MTQDRIFKQNSYTNRTVEERLGYQAKKDSNSHRISHILNRFSTRAINQTYRQRPTLPIHQDLVYNFDLLRCIHLTKGAMLIIEGRQIVLI